MLSKKLRAVAGVIVDNQVLDRIKKLLALANSSNEHEAKLAAEKASELLLRHNLTMQQLNQEETEYDVAENVISMRILGPAEKMALFTTRDFFFVEVVVGRHSGKKAWYVSLIGEKTNLQVATYVYNFLLLRGRAAWKQYISEYPGSKPASYFLGFADGLASQLKANKKAVETSMSLTLQPDPNLKVLLKKVFPHSTTETIKTRGQADISARAAGFHEGTKTKISRGLEEGATASQKYLRS